VWRFELSDLAPTTGYGYVLEVDGHRVDDRTGEFTTFPAGPASFTIAVGSCARLGSNGVVYETIRNLKPDLFLIPGDFFYADHIETLDQFAAAYTETLTSPAQAALLAEVPVAYLWDDHDYGRNDADSTSPTRDLARTAFATYVPHYPLTGSGTINQAFTLGRTRFLLLDNRSARDPKSDPDGPGKTMLGPDQLDWLETQLLDANGKYPLIVIVTSVPWIAEAAAGADHWGGYTAERGRLADFIAANDITGLLMVAGDAHMVAIDDGSNTNYSAAGNATFPLFHAAALDRPGSAKGGPYSEGAYPGGGQFGLIEVTDTGTGQIIVRLSGFDWTGARIVDYSFPVVAPDLSP
jgi:phosphodiesterase/alkaline phosphatase D-like protein